MPTLFDNHGRPLNYLRLAVTDRCNLRCTYCMPGERVTYLPKKDLLSFEEIFRIVSLMAAMGINKIRLTGGEPFVRNDFMNLLRSITQIEGIKSVHLTTNGTLTSPHVKELKSLGIASVNLSLDTLDAERYKKITLRNEFVNVMETLTQLIDSGIPVKINTVVMEEKNTEDILDLVALTKASPVSVRFIEEMPFNGKGDSVRQLQWTYKRIINHIQEYYPSLTKVKDELHSTSYNYSIDGHLGNIGVIAAFSRTFCGSCNRIRLTSQGLLKTCLYQSDGFDLKKSIRSGYSDNEIKRQLLNIFNQRAANGWEAEERSPQPKASMSTIGG